jgi:hypothetical protein
MSETQHSTCDFYASLALQTRKCTGDATFYKKTPYTDEQVDVRGVLVTLLDTAGIRHTEDKVEAVGVQRSQSVASAADIVVFIYDAEARSS